MRRIPGIILASTLALFATGCATGGPIAGQRWEDLPESDRVRVMRDWDRDREDAQQTFEALLMGIRPGSNGSAVLDAATGLALLAIAEGSHEALPRRLDRSLDLEQLAAVRPIVDSVPARMMIDLLLDYRDLEYSYRPLQWPQDPHRPAEIMQVIRLLPALAAVRADGGGFDRAYDTLTLLFPIADWLIEERPVILNAILAQASVRDGVRHIEELAQRTPPAPKQIENLKAALVRGREALDIGAVLRGETAYSQWLATTDLHDWREFTDREEGDAYWQILQEAADMEPWERDSSDWLDRIQDSTEWGPILIPEVRHAIDSVFETRFRIDLGLEMLDYYADGTTPEFPVDPFTGSPLRSARTESGCVVYSIGLNRQDDGGVDRWEGKGHFDAVWRLPCELIHDSMVQAADPSAS